MKRLLAMAVSLVALSGCSDFERIDFVFDSSPPVDVIVTYDQIRIPEGVAVITTALPTAGDGVMSSDTSVLLNAEDSGVLGVAFALPQALEQGGDKAPWSFVLFGARAGSTKVTVRVDDAVKKDIPVVVEAQSP